MGFDNMGRKRKKLEEKSTPIMFRLDNKTIFKLCEMYNIEVNKDMEVLEDAVKKEIIARIKQIILQITK